MLTLGRKYNIKFPHGTTIVMELIETEISTDPKNHQIRYTFLDSTNTKVMITNGAVKRLKIEEVMHQSLPNLCLGENESKSFVCIPLPRETTRDWLSDDDLYS